MIWDQATPGSNPGAPTMNSSERMSSDEAFLTPRKKEFIPNIFNALLRIPRPEIPEPIVAAADARGLKEKPEFHLSVIAFNSGAKIKKLENAQKLKGEIKRMFEGRSWSYRLTPAYFLIEKSYPSPEHTRQSIVQKVELDDLEGFYRELNGITRLDFETPAPHLTLFTGATDANFEDEGIGLFSGADLAKYTKEDLTLSQ